MYSERTQRRLRMILKAMMGVVAVAITFWLVWYEFREGIFTDRTFMLLITMWMLLGFVLFLDALGESSKKTSDEKIGDLIKKMDEYIAKNELGKEQETKGGNDD